jgi:anti-sigma28 factor (negative regulator of flagellin synthesis)
MNSNDHEHPIEHAASAEHHAHAEWLSLLDRLQSSDAPDARLRQLRHAIASGEFQIDARAIAERLIARLLST